MSHCPASSPFRYLSALGCALLAGTLGACASQPSASTATPAAAGAPATAVAAARSPAEQSAAPEGAAQSDSPESPSPPAAQRPRGFDFPSEPADGEWLVDDRGRRYFAHAVAKIPGTYALMANDTRVKFWFTPPFELLRQDEESFYVKIYGTPDEIPRAIAAPTASGPTPEQIAASYQVAGAESDVLRFERFSRGLPSRGQWRHGFDLADVDGDGALDLVHGPPRKGGTHPVIFFGDGKGTWRRSNVPMPADRPLDYGDAAAADFNADGIVDLAFASHLRGLTVMIGDGKGGYTLWSRGLDYAIGGPGPAFSSRALEVVDWNGDGRLDLVAAAEGPSLAVDRSEAGASYRRGGRGLAVYLNQGDGSWVGRFVQGVSFGDALAVGQLDDGEGLDVFTASGSMGNRRLLYRRAGESLEEVAVDGLRPKSVFRAVAAGDFDGDGRQDLVAGYTSSELPDGWRSGVDVLLAREDGSWERRPAAVAASQAGIWALAAGDLDADGDLDLAAATGDGAVWVLLGDGKGGFARELSPELALPELAGCTGYHLRLADLDGDGMAELLASFAGEEGMEQKLGLGEPGPACKPGGSLQVWKPVRAAGR